MGIQKTKIEVTPEITRQIALRKAIGISLRELESEFGFSRPVINRVLSSDLAKSVVKGVTEDAVGSAITSVRKAMADMTDTVSEVLLHHLKEEKSLEAVKIVLRGLGMDTMEKNEAKQQQVFTVVLPGQKEPKDVVSE